MKPHPGTLVRPRWRKVLSDLWGNPIRTVLVVASIAVGLFAVGMITTIHAILTADMRSGYAAVNPATVIISAGDFNDDTVDLAKNVDGVREVVGARNFYVQVHSNGDRWSRMSVKAIQDIDRLSIDKIKLEQGVWPPKNRELVIDRSKRADFPAPLGGMVEVQLPGGEIKRLKLVGVVHDETVGTTSIGGGYFMAPAQGYISMDTLEWLGQPDLYNTLYLTTTSGQDDASHLRVIANKVSDEIENNNGLVYNSMVRGMHDHPNASYTDAMAGVLIMLGALVVFLSGFLITNTLSSLLNQQAQQIAIMKTIGARSFQVIGVYLSLIFIFSLLALAASLPLSSQGAFRLLDFLSGKINFTLSGYRVIPSAVLLMTVIAVAVPQVAGALPVLRGSRIKVQEALSGSLLEDDPSRGNWFDRRLARMRRFSRPVLISLRNTFRHKVRLALTLLTLSLGGTIFIATFNVRASLEDYIAQLGRYFIADVNLTMDHAYRINEVQQELKSMPDIAGVEGWAFASCEILLDNDQAGDAVQLLGPPSSTRLLDPMLIAGRWVRPGERDAIALSERFRSRFPNLKPGDTIRLRVNGKKTTWTVVGFFQLAGKSAGFLAYTNYEYLSELVHEPGKAVTFRIISSHKNLSDAQQRELTVRIQNFLQARGYRISEVTSGKSLLDNSADGLNTLTTFLLIMALLTALVGSIGLMGTMSMNVMDRTREIGVMRAIGASDRTVMSLVIVEGVMVGGISWALGVAASVPISKLMSDVVTRAIFETTTKFAFTLTGPVYWMALVLVLSVLASVIPARNAARITIREALAYE